MKPRKPLQRRTPIRRKAVVKHTAAFFERKKEAGREAYRRRKLKRELLAECPRDGDVILCPRCKKPPDFRGLQLVHKQSLGTGGKTTRANCVIRCAPCHFGYGEPWSHRTEGKPGESDPSGKGPSQIFERPGIEGKSRA